MSTDYHLVCEPCKSHIHIGQTMAGWRFTSGFGERDVKGQVEIGEFLRRHEHGLPLQFMTTDAVSSLYVDEGSP